MKIIDSDNYKMSASPGINLLICRVGWRRVSLKWAEGTLHGLLALILWGLSPLNIYIPCCPAIVSSLPATPFIREQGKDWQGGRTPPPPRIPRSFPEFLQGKWRQSFQISQSVVTTGGLYLWFSSSIHGTGLPLPPVPANENRAGVCIVKTYLLQNNKSSFHLRLLCLGKSPVYLKSWTKWICFWHKRAETSSPKVYLPGKGAANTMHIYRCVTPSKSSASLCYSLLGCKMGKIISTF